MLIGLYHCHLLVYGRIWHTNSKLVTLTPVPFENHITYSHSVKAEKPVTSTTTKNNNISLIFRLYINVQNSGIM